MGYLMDQVEADAFSSGQVSSKLWLCEELEKIYDHIDQIWIYGGWYGMSAFLLKVRNNIQIGKIRSWDVDPACEKIADSINENWVWQEWAFKAYTGDCNDMQPAIGCPDLIINTSTEHFDSMGWWEKIPNGMPVVLQGNNMPHEDHVIHTDSLEAFSKLYPLTTVDYAGQKDFKYETWGFSRFMLIGIK
jgi:hypothetical protein